MIFSYDFVDSCNSCCSCCGCANVFIGILIRCLEGITVKVLLGFSRSVCSVFALLFCALVLFSPSSAVGAVYTDTVKITAPNTVLSGDTITVDQYGDLGRGIEAKIRNAGELNNVKISTFGSYGTGVVLESADLIVKSSGISAIGAMAYGVYLDNSQTNIADSDISAGNATGIHAVNGSVVTVSGGTIKASGQTHLKI